MNQERPMRSHKNSHYITQSIMRDNLDVCKSTLTSLLTFSGSDQLKKHTELYHHITA